MAVDVRAGARTGGTVLSRGMINLQYSTKRRVAEAKKLKVRCVRRAVVGCVCFIALLWCFFIWNFVNSSVRSMGQNMPASPPQRTGPRAQSTHAPAKKRPSLPNIRASRLLGTSSSSEEGRETTETMLRSIKLKANNTGFATKIVARAMQRNREAKEMLVQRGRTARGQGVADILPIMPAPQTVRYDPTTGALLRLDRGTGLTLVFENKVVGHAAENGFDMLEGVALDVLRSTLVFPTKYDCEATTLSASSLHIVSIVVVQLVSKVQFLQKEVLEYSTGNLRIKLDSIFDSPDPVFDRQKEMYRLIIHEDTVVVVAVTHSGALHGLRTLVGLFNPPVGLKAVCHTLPYPTLEIFDFPRFAHRGFVIDTAHHFKPVEFLKRLIFGMGTMKLNVLHWHVTDHQAFGLKLPSEPTLATGNNFFRGKTHRKSKRKHSPGKTFYTMEETQEVVRYGKALGVYVLLEFDVPGHALGWEKGYPVAVNVHCKNEVSAPREFPNCNANLDPRVEATYSLLRSIFSDLKKHLPNDALKLLHLGGDETSFKTWARPQFEDWMEAEGIVQMKKWSVAEVDPITGDRLDTPHRLLELFERRLGILIDKYLSTQGTVVVRWEEIFKPHLEACCFFPRNQTVVQMWRKPYGKKAKRTKEDILHAGFRGIIVANEEFWYLDPNPSDQFWQRWHTRYKYDPLKVSPPHGETYTLPSTYQHRVFGGEAACWGRCMETQDSFDTYVWVPLTAISERLWSARSVMSYENAEMRLTRTLALLSRRWRRTEEGAGDELDMVHLIRFHSRSADKRTVRI